MPKVKVNVTKVEGGYIVESEVVDFVNQQVERKVFVFTTKDDAVAYVTGLL